MLGRWFHTSAVTAAFPSQHRGVSWDGSGWGVDGQGGASLGLALGLMQETDGLGE